MPPHEIRWSEIDKIKFYTIGTGLYSVLTTALHPLTVLKTRQQILGPSHPFLFYPPPLVTATSPPVTAAAAVSSSRGVFDVLRYMYRGLGVVLSVAVPARAVYILVLEGSKENITNKLKPLTRGGGGGRIMTPLGQKDIIIRPSTVATISSGVAGGLAALTAQFFVVPIDVISQRQIIMGGGVVSIVRGVILSEGGGVRGLYKGFSMSVAGSIPGGVVWWAAYGGCQSRLKGWSCDYESDNHDDRRAIMWRRGVVQLISGVCAALVTSVVTQPLDVVKTRFQVEGRGIGLGDVGMELWREVGIRGFWRGLGPRVGNMALWGTVMSSAYEYLKFLSFKDQTGYGLRRNSLGYVCNDDII